MYLKITLNNHNFNQKLLRPPPQLPGNDVGLLDQVWIEHRPALPRPLLQLGQLVDQEDPAALGFSTGLHNPCGIGIFPAIFH